MKFSFKAKLLVVMTAYSAQVLADIVHDPTYKGPGSSSSLRFGWGYLEFQAQVFADLPGKGKLRALRDVTWYDSDLVLRRGTEDVFKTCKPGSSAEEYISSLVCFWSSVFKNKDCRDHEKVDSAFQQQSPTRKTKLHLFCFEGEEFENNDCRLVPLYPLVWSNIGLGSSADDVGWYLEFTDETWAPSSCTSKLMTPPTSYCT